MSSIASKASAWSKKQILRELGIASAVSFVFVHSFACVLISIFHLADQGGSAGLNRLNLGLAQNVAAEALWQLVTVHELACRWGDWAELTAWDGAKDIVWFDVATEWAVLLCVLAVDREGWRG